MYTCDLHKYHKCIKCFANDQIWGIVFLLYFICFIIFQIFIVQSCNIAKLQSSSHKFILMSRLFYLENYTTFVLSNVKYQSKKEQYYGTIWSKRIKFFA